MNVALAPLPGDRWTARWDRCRSKRDLRFFRSFRRGYDGRSRRDGHGRKFQRIRARLRTHYPAEIQRARLAEAVAAVTDIAGSESGFALWGDRWSTSVGQADQAGSG